MAAARTSCTDRKAGMAAGYTNTVVTAPALCTSHCDARRGAPSCRIGFQVGASSFARCARASSNICQQDRSDDMAVRD